MYNSEDVRDGILLRMYVMGSLLGRSCLHGQSPVPLPSVASLGWSLSSWVGSGWEQHCVSVRCGRMGSVSPVACGNGATGAS